MKTLFRIKSEYNREDSLYYHIDKLVIDEVDDEMVKVHDIDDGNEFWIAKNKLELV